MARDTHAAGDGAILPQRRASGNSRVSGDRRVLTNADVVGYVHQVIDLDTVTDHGVFQCAPVDGAVRTDFYLSTDAYTAELMHFLPASLRRGKTKPVRADHRVAVNNAARAEHNTMRDGYVGGKIAVGANDGAGTDKAAGAHLNAIAQDDVLGDNGLRTDAHPLPQTAVGGHYRSEEHTSELQSRGHLVCRLLLEKKNSKQ